MKEERRIDSSLTGLEIRNGEEWLISQVQAASFPEEIASSKQHGLVKDSNLANLNPFMCPTSHFLRVGAGLSLEAGYRRSSGGCESSSHRLLGHVCQQILQKYIS